MRFNREGGSKKAIYETLSPTQLRNHSGLGHGHNDNSCRMGIIKKEKQYSLLMDWCRLQKSQEWYQDVWSNSQLEAQNWHVLKIENIAARVKELKKNIKNSAFEHITVEMTCSDRDVELLVWELQASDICF